MLVLAAFIISCLTLIFCLFKGNYVSGGNEHNSEYNLNYYKKLNKDNYLTSVLKGVKPIKYYDDIPQRMPYESFHGIKRHTVHIGQLKLFLTELEFLTERLKSKDDSIIMVYAGSAPCHHAVYLSSMFPNLKIVMVDPNEHLFYYPNGTSYDKTHMDETVYFKCNKGNKFNKKERNINMYTLKIQKLEKQKNFDDILSNGEKFDKIIENKDYKQIIDFINSSKYKYYIIEDYFTNELAMLFSKFDKFIFCSDIRSKAESNKIPGDLDLIWNLSMQYNWLNIMQPEASMLKFRCPFFEKDDKEQFLRLSDEPIYREAFTLSKEYGIDFIEDYKNNKFRYIKPTSIYIQAFPGINSSESRHISDDYNNIVEIDSKEYEDKFFYYNRIHREYGYHNDHEKIFDSKSGFDACGDCGLTYQIFKDYYDKYDKEKSTLKNIKYEIDNLMKTIRRNFKEQNSDHGKFFKPYKIPL